MPMNRASFQLPLLPHSHHYWICILPAMNSLHAILITICTSGSDPLSYSCDDGVRKMYSGCSRSVQQALTDLHLVVFIFQYSLVSIIGPIWHTLYDIPKLLMHWMQHSGLYRVPLSYSNLCRWADGRMLQLTSWQLCRATQNMAYLSHHCHHPPPHYTHNSQCPTFPWWCVQSWRLVLNNNKLCHHCRGILRSCRKL
jgi:hypothetical protein